MHKTQSWTDDNVAKLVKQKQKEELERCLVELKDEINFSLDAEKLLQRYIEKRLKELGK